MGPGALIVLEEELELEVESTEFKSCSDLWQGIVMEKDSRLVIKDSEISLAHRAIEAKGHCSIAAVNTAFLDNHIGIDYEGVAGDIGDVLISGCRFETVDGVPSNTGLDFYGYAAIQSEYLRNLQLTGELMADGSYQPTTMRNLRNGVVAYSTVMDVESTAFEEMHAITGPPYPIFPTGYGILLTGITHRLGGLHIAPGTHPEAFAASFDDMHTGIYVEKAHAYIANSSMEAVERGITLRDCQLRTLKLYENTISTTRAGIELIHNQPALIQVEENDVTLEFGDNPLDQQGSAIRAADLFGVNSYNYFRFLNNIVHLEKGRDGIRLDGTRFMWLHNNYVYLDATGHNRRGIRAEGLYKPFIEQNQIFGPTTISTQHFGIWADGLSEPVISCNTVDQLGAGIQFWGMNDATDLRGNIFDDAEVGLRLGQQYASGSINYSFIGSQIQRGNLWEGSFSSGYGAIHSSDVPADWLQSSFRVNNSNIASYLPTHNGNGPVISWFDNDPNSTIPIYSCPPAPAPPVVNEVYSTISGLEEAIIDGDFEVPEYEMSSDSIAKARLLVRWTSAEVDSLQDQDAVAFVAASSGSDWEAYKDNRAVLLEAMQTSGEYLPALDTDYQSIVTTLTLLRSLKDSENRANGLATLSTQLGAADTLCDFVATKRENAISDWAGAVKGAKASDPEFLQMEMEVQNTIAKMHISQAIGTSDSLILLMIAESCPWQVGDAVYHARALFARLDPDRDFNDDYCSIVSQPLERDMTALPVTPLQLRIFPNPVNDYVLIEADRPFATDRPVRLFDALGRTVAVNWVPGEANTLLLETDGLKAGMYYVEILSEDGQRKQGEFIKL